MASRSRFEADSLETIRSRKEALVQKYQSQVMEARKTNDNRQFRDANKALDTIDSAWEQIRTTHDETDA